MHIEVLIESIGIKEIEIDPGNLIIKESVNYLKIIKHEKIQKIITKIDKWLNNEKVDDIESVIKEVFKILIIENGVIYPLTRENDILRVIIKTNIKNGKFILPFCTHWHGDFNCSFNELETLEGSPQYVYGMFDCHFNNLKTLKGGPEIIQGSFDCSYNKLSDLKYGPIKVGKGYYCNNNAINSLEGVPSVMNGDFYCSNNKLISLKGGPKYIIGWFGCSNNKLLNNEGYPLRVLGY